MTNPARSSNLFTRLFLGNLLLVGVIVVLGGLIAYPSLNAHYRQEMDANQDHLATVLQQYFQQSWPLPPERIDPLCKQLRQEPDERFTVIAADGTVLGESDAEPAKMENHRDRPEVQAALAGRPGASVRYSPTLGVNFRYVARPVVHDGQVAAVVRVATPIRAILAGEAVIRNALLWAGLAGVLAAGTLGLLLSWLWYSPLRRIADTARQIAAGEPAARALIGGPSELGQLGRALNQMRETLGGQVAALATQRENLQTVLANLREGVVAFDGQGRVVLMNRAARDLLGAGAGDFAGRPLAEAVTRLEAADLCHQALATGRLLGRQLEADGPAGRRTLDVQAVPLAGQGAEAVAGLLVVHDITDLARTAAVKAEFVANASHELRTPLATVRAAVDSMMEPGGDEQTYQRFLTILDRQVTRLEGMTRDLLDLHLVETGKIALKLEEVALGALAEWAGGQFGGRAQEKGLALEVRAEPPDRRLRTDVKLLHLILQNLLDNAIKFTPASSVAANRSEAESPRDGAATAPGRVECVLAGAAGDVTFTVRDTGCGIRPEDQPRVFERFFQADAARSGDPRVRGTGLGLAIVRHAAERLGAKVSLASEVGKGSTFVVTLPEAKTR